MAFVKELPPLALIAKETGKKIFALQAHVKANPQEWEHKEERKPDGTIVHSIATKADKEAHYMIKNFIAAHPRFKDLGFVSEEGTEEEIAAGIQASERIETDPLDNTSGYAKGKPGRDDGYSVNIGRVKEGVPVEGAVYFPAKQELFFTSEDGKKAYYQKGDGPVVDLAVKDGALRQPFKVAVGFNNPNLEGLGREKEDFVTGGEPAQYRSMKVADGTYDITQLNVGDGGYNSWDIVGPDAVLRAAGGAFVTRQGDLMEYQTGTYKVADHYAGSLDCLITRNIAKPELRQQLNRTQLY